MCRCLNQIKMAYSAGTSLSGEFADLVNHASKKIRLLSALQFDLLFSVFSKSEWGTVCMAWSKIFEFKFCPIRPHVNMTYFRRKPHDNMSAWFSAVFTWYHVKPLVLSWGLVTRFATKNLTMAKQSTPALPSNLSDYKYNLGNCTYKNDMTSSVYFESNLVAISEWSSSWGMSFETYYIGVTAWLRLSRTLTEDESHSHSYP